MPDDRGTVREIVWQDLCPGLILTRVFRVALRLRVLLLAAVGILAMVAGWRVVGAIFATDNVTQPRHAWIIEQSAWPWDWPRAINTVPLPGQPVNTVPMPGEPAAQREWAAAMEGSI